ncbi:MAG TPA: dihydroorotase [Armatimonadota bacterium]|jgi:dihydroorotase
MRLWIRGGRLLDPASGTDAVGDLLVMDGKIAELAPGGLREPVAEAEVWQLSETHWVCPGFIDLHVHLREPGYEHKETIATGSAAAASGGWATICCMPNTNPPIDNRAVVEMVLRRGAKAGRARVLPIASAMLDLGQDRLAEMAELREAGAVALTDDAFPLQRSESVRRVLEYCRMLDVPFVVHCEDKSLSEGGAMNEGAVATRLGLPGMPSVAEDIALARNLLLSEYTGARLHACHVSTAGSVELVRLAKARGVRVTAEACPHHFSLTDEAVSGYDTDTKMNPPLRAQADVDAVVAGLADGTLDCIATDHAPHAAEEKDVEYARAPFGIVGSETALGLVLKCLVEPGHLSPLEAVRRLSLSPALAFGLSLGSLADGSAADVTIVDTQSEWRVDRSRLLSKSKNTPYHGWTLPGRAWATLVDGKPVYRLEEAL